MSSAIWTWDAHDGAGNRIGELTTATGKQVTFKRNWYIEALCTVGIDDDITIKLKTALLAGWARLRLYRRSFDPVTRTYSATNTLVFYGWLHPIIETGEEEKGAMQIVARSPLARYNGFPLTFGSAQGALAGGAGADGIVMENIATVYITPFLGLGTGTRSDTAVQPGRYWQAGQDALALMVAMSQQNNGIDFLERFGTNPAVHPTLAVLDTTNSQGSDKPNAKFEYGPTTLANLRSAQIVTAPPVNYVFVQGANGLSSLQQNAGSQTTYGAWTIPPVSLATINDQATLDSRANALLRPAPVKTLQMVPDAAAPRPFDDFFLGDTVHAYVNRGSMQLTPTGARVNGFTVVIDDEGLEQASIPDPVSPEEEAFIHASLTVEL